ncbi:hypothetical protein DMENIID0001_096130 [Sergentomyia squamirostris]
MSQTQSLFGSQEEIPEVPSKTRYLNILSDAEDEEESPTPFNTRTFLVRRSYSPEIEESSPISIKKQKLDETVQFDENKESNTENDQDGVPSSPESPESEENPPDLVKFRERQVKMKEIMRELKETK